MSVRQVGIIILLYVRGTGFPRGKSMSFESHLHAFKSPLGFLAQNGCYNDLLYGIVVTIKEAPSGPQ